MLSHWVVVPQILSLCLGVQLAIAQPEAILVEVLPDAPQVDGDTWEWQAARHDMSHISPRFAPTAGDGDLSASFRIGVTATHLYIAVEVIDDDVVFGRESFSKTWRQDCVEIYIDGNPAEVVADAYDLNDSQIRVSSEDGNSVQLEGASRVAGHVVQVPLLWEARGVEAGVRQAGSGYSIEVAIPRSVLGVAHIDRGTRLGLNVKVIDVDGDEDLTVMSWQPDPASKGWMSTASLGHIEVATGTVDQGSVKVKEMTVVLGSLDGESTPVEEAARMIAAGHGKRANSLLVEIASANPSVPARAWAKYSLASFALEDERWGDGISWLQSFLDEHPEHLGLRNWVAAVPMVDLARANWNLGKIGEAYEVLARAYTTANPQSFTVLYSIGEAIGTWTQQAPEETAPRIKEILVEYEALFPTACRAAIAGGGKRGYVANVLLGHYQERRGNTTEALELYRAANRYDPGDPDPYIYIGRCLAKLGEHEAAIGSYREALGCEPVVAEHVDQVAQGLVSGYLALGRTQDAKETVAGLAERMSVEAYALMPASVVGH